MVHADCAPGIPPAVKGANLFLTRRCNLRCRYCFVDKGRARHLSPDVAARAVEFILGQERLVGEGFHVGYIGGEPLLDWRGFVAVTEALCAARPGLNIGFTTNGTLLDEDKLAFIREHGLRVVISLDGDPTAMADRVDARGRPAYPAAVSGLRRLVAAGVPALVQLTVTPANAGRLLDGVRHLVGLGARRLIFGFAIDVPWTREALDDLAQGLADVFAFYEDVLRHGLDVTLKTLDDEVLSYLVVVSGRERIAEACPMAREVCAIDVDGTIYPCQALVDLPEWAIGHVDSGFDADRRRVAGSVANRALEPCHGCRLRDFCRKCPRANVLVNAHPLRTDGVSCTLGKLMYALVERLVARLRAEDDPHFSARFGGLFDGWHPSSP